MASKFYAVKAGRNPGIYLSWDECQKQTKGFSGAIFKSFKERCDAENFIKGTVINESIIIESDKNMLQIFVDGSFRNNKYSWAFVVYENGKEIYNDYGIGTSESANSMQNVAGELSATMRAANWLLKNGKKAVINLDYQGIDSWVTEEWQCKNEHTKKYANYMKPLFLNGLFVFNKVKGHSGNIGNERADELCALAFI